MADFDLAGFKNALGATSEKGIVTDALLDSLRRVESSNNPKATNTESGAMGAYQFMPKTVEMLGKQGIKFDPYNEPEARVAAKKYLEQLVEQNNGDVKKALAQYGGFKQKDPSAYVSNVLGGQKESTGFDLSGFKSALDSNKAPQQMASQFENKTTAAPKKPINKAEAEMDRMFGNLPGYQPTKAFLATTGETIASTPAVLGQLAGKALSTVAPESGEALYQMSTKQIKENRKVTEGLRESNPVATTAGDITGALISPVNKLIPFGGPAQTLTGAVFKGAGQGAIANVLTTPVTDENKAYLTEKLKQAFTGGAVGGVAGGLIKGATSIAQPVANQLSQVGKDAVETLRKAGVPVDVAQATGSKFLQRTKAALYDNPFTAGKEEEFAALQRAAYNKAIAKTMGEEADAITPPVIQAAKNRLGDIYDDVASRNQIHFDKTIENNLRNIESEAQDILTPEQFNIVKKQIDNITNKAETQGGGLHGEQYQSIKKVLDKLSGSRDTDVGMYARELKDVLLDGLTRTAKATGNDADVALLAKANREYGNMKKIEDVVLKNPEGNVSPSLLLNSLSAKGKRYSFYQDDPELAQLASAGKSVLEQKLPNSGTFARFLAQNPMTALANAGYHKGSQMIMQNPTTAAYLEKGIKPGVVRGVLETPAKIGAIVPPYLAKPGAAGATSLREMVNLKNRQLEQENR